MSPNSFRSLNYSSRRLFGSLLTAVLLLPVPALAAFRYTDWALVSAPAGWSISDLGNVLTVTPQSGSGNDTIDITGQVASTSTASQQLGVTFGNLNTFTLNKGSMRINIWTDDSSAGRILKMEGNNEFTTSRQPNDAWANGLVTPINFATGASAELHIEIKFTGDAKYQASTPCTLTFTP